MSYSAGHPIRAVGGRIALDFLNTANWRGDGSVAVEKLESLNDLELWAAHLGLGDLALPQTVSVAKEFRQELRELFTQTAERQDIDSLSVPVSTQSLMGVVALSAVSIIADVRERGRVRQCPANNCGWLFLDESPTGRRKWCSMETCGNKAKAARHYARHRQTDP